MTGFNTPGCIIEFTIPINHLLCHIWSCIRKHKQFISMLPIESNVNLKIKLIRQRIQRLKPMIVQYMTHATLLFQNIMRVQNLPKLRNERIVENSGSMYMQLLSKHLRSGYCVILYYSVIPYYSDYCSERHHSLPLMYSNKEGKISRPRIDGAQISSSFTRRRIFEHLLVLAATS